MHEGTDLLDHTGLATAVADIALSAAAPVNIALFGSWGSGKSSIYSMLEQRIAALEHPWKTRVVRYDAWKYGGHSLKRNFISSIAEDLELSQDRFESNLHQNTERNDLSIGNWVKRNYPSLLTGVLVAVVVACLWLLGVVGLNWLLKTGDLLAAARASIASAGTVFGLALVALLVGPKVLEGAVVKVSSAPPSADDEFARRFRELIGEVKSQGAERLVVFIDELDRCSPEDVVATLIDLKTFLDQEDCVFIVAADREVIERALQKVPQAKPVREEEPYYATPGAFLDKIFQHQISLPPLRPRALTKFARSLVQEQGGLWRELREQALEDSFETVVFALVPIHVRSPRRVKVLLNNFATNARIAEARGLPWLERAAEIAVMTVLQTEFPNVAKDMLRWPRLLDLLLGHEEPSTDELQDLMLRYGAPYSRDDPPTGVNAEALENRSQRTSQAVENSETPAGLLLAEGLNQELAASRARLTLNRQLAAYLAKVRAGGIPEPKPDLFYLQSAGHVDGLPDPRLGDVIDFAADSDPDEVVAAFNGQPSSVLAIAVMSLVAGAEDAVGRGRGFVIESACRLLEAMDEDDIRAVGPGIRPTIFAEVRSSTSWRPQATPGAFILAVMLGATDDARSLAELLKTNANSPSLLIRAGSVLPYASETQTAMIHSLFADVYNDMPEPLHSSLRELPLASALQLWNATGESLFSALENLENPRLEEGSPGVPTAINGRGSATQPKQPGTGDGRLRMQQLFEALLSRPDGETMLSLAYETAQRSKSRELLDETLELAESVLSRLSEPAVITHHVLLGILSAPNDNLDGWAGRLRPASTDSSKDPVAAAVISAKLLPAVSAARDAEILTRAGDLIVLVAPRASKNEETLHAIHDLFEDLPWVLDRVAKDSDAAKNLELRRTVAHRTVQELRKADLLDAADTDPMLAGDIFAGIESAVLDEDLQAQMIELIDLLEPEAAKLLDDLLDEYEEPEGERLAILRLRTRSRLRYHGEPFTGEELSGLDENAASSAIANDWLALEPRIEDVLALVPRLSMHWSALKPYAARITRAERSRLWIALEQTHALDNTLAAVGAIGVDDSAVEYMSEKIFQASRQEGRNRSVERLLLANIGASEGESVSLAQRAANNLSKRLLETEIAGDSKLAAKVILWAGGAVRGYLSVLRELFDQALKQNDKVFTAKTRGDLADAGLLSHRTSSPLSWLLGK
ncbi:KAP family P-loop NTPase fold protein [Pseudarthrobacter sp. LMD1-1-1.1]|uniref:KAP family P-loop NTPase fold protein n=1 Tax=Pseudarthrobacter sp. LMD1-1-1.1 TaxID=3135242 RepID=UPI00342205AD